MSQNLSGAESYCKGTRNSKNKREAPYNPLCSTTRVLAAVWVFSARLCPAIFAASVAFWLQNGCTSISRGCNPGANRVHRRLRRAIPVAFWAQKGCTHGGKAFAPLPYLRKPKMPNPRQPSGRTSEQKRQPSRPWNARSTRLHLNELGHQSGEERFVPRSASLDVRKINSPLP